jgi:hypothetical protein
MLNLASATKVGSLMSKFSVGFKVFTVVTVKNAVL